MVLDVASLPREDAVKLSAACTRTDPLKVEEVIRAGGGVQYPVEDECHACKQKWDASHMMVLFEKEGSEGGV